LAFFKKISFLFFATSNGIYFFDTNVLSRFLLRFTTPESCTTRAYNADLRRWLLTELVSRKRYSSGFFFGIISQSLEREALESFFLYKTE
jgi:hypothetical protein